MAKLQKILHGMATSPKNVRYEDLHKVCVEHFGEPRQTSGSHAVFRTPWPGDPRVNIQQGKNGKAKPYQVAQVLEAIERLEEQGEEQT